MSGVGPMPPIPGAVWSALPVPAFLTTQRVGREYIFDCNPAAELFTSTSAVQLKNQIVEDRLHIDAPIADAVARARLNRAPIFINETKVSVGERASAYCNIQLAPMNDPADTLLWLIAPRDIAGRLGRKQSAKSAAKSAIGMAEMLAHEIKNPLAGIAGAAQLLSMELAPADRELTDLIVGETQRIVKLLEQVETFGDQRPPDRRPTNVHDVLERARRSAAVGFASHMQILDDYDPSLPDVLADPDQLLQVFLNLLKNAAEVQPEGGTIRIRTYFERGLNVQAFDGSRMALPLHIEIVDNGPGLAPAIAESVFEPFVSGRDNGTGLGLALVSKIIAAHEGWIEVNSQPGHTVFRISLPMAQTKARNQGAAPLPPPKASASTKEHH